MNAVRKPKIMSADDAVSLVKSGMTIALGNLSSEPLALTAALWERAGELRDVTLVSGMMLTGYPFLQGSGADAFKLRTWFMPGTLLGGKAKDLKADFLPLTWAQTIRYLDAQAFDVVLMQVSPADRNGYHSFGINTSQMRAMIRGAGIEPQVILYLETPPSRDRLVELIERANARGDVEKARRAAKVCERFMADHPLPH